MVDHDKHMENEVFVRVFHDKHLKDQHSDMVDHDKHMVFEVKDADNEVFVLVIRANVRVNAEN